MQSMIIVFILWTLLNSGATQLTVNGPTVSYAGGRATFTCSNGENTVSMQWLVNGTSLNSSNMNIISEFSQITRVGNLLFRDVLQYNETTVQCSATSSSGRITYSNVITMLVQGLLSAVGDLNAAALDSTISLTWNPPFTLDITNVDPDITYRVDVINSTSSQVIHSQGGITVTQYNYTTSLSPERRACDVFKLTIIPVNLVGNGNESSIFYHYFNHVPTVLGHYAVVMKNGLFSFHIMMSDIVCDVIVSGISVMYYNEVVETSDINAIIDDLNRTIIEVTGNLTLNRIYNVTMVVSASGQSRTIHQSLSTHDVQRTEMNDVSINVSYVKNTTAKGVLCALIYFRNQRVDFNNSVYIVLDVRNRELAPLYLSRGNYTVLSYDMESTGLLEPGYPAYIDSAESKMDQGSIPSPRSSALENCNVKHHNGYITASCVYPQNSAASGFQTILQFNDPEDMESVYRLMVNQTVNHNTSVSFSVDRSGTYCVIIFPIINGEMLDGNPSFWVELQVETDQAGSTSSSTSISTPAQEKNSILKWAIPLLVVVVLVVVVVIFITVVMVRKWKAVNVPPNHDGE